MRRADRLFEIIDLLRRARRPLTAARLAESLEVSVRTVYRDIHALQAMRTPIDGEAGVGYVLRPGYDLPPRALDVEEREALRLAIDLLARSGDRALCRAGASALRKLDVGGGGEGLHGSGWHAVPSPGLPAPDARRAVRDGQVLELQYHDAQARPSRRRVRPCAVLYYLESTVLAAWCERRADFRHFRLDRVAQWSAQELRPAHEASALRERWWRRHGARQFGAAGERISP